MASAATPLPSPPVPAWRAAFRDFSQPHGFQPLEVEGRLPEGLQGTLVRVGPVRFGHPGHPYGHWFDGDGGLVAVRLSGGRAQGAARELDTPSIRAERQSGKVLYANYGTAAPPLRRFPLRVKNSANTSVLHWQGRLFALLESTVPTEVSLEDLRTLGETDLEGLVLQAFSAHPHAVVSRRARYNFGMRGSRMLELDLYELPDQGPARRLPPLRLAAPSLVHDFIATERHLVFFIPPLRLHLLRMLLGLGAYADNMQWLPQRGVEVIAVPLDEPSKPVRFAVEPFYQWHFANAYEEGGRLVVDYVRYPDFASSNHWLREVLHGVPSSDFQGRLHRATLDLEAQTLRSEPLMEPLCEFPMVDPRRAGARHRFIYASGYSAHASLRGPQDALAKVDTESGRQTLVALGPEQYPSEPLFVPRPGGTAEDDGWLVSLVYDGRSDSSHVAVLDARALEEGPLARAHLGHAFPFTFHGTWISG